MLAFLLFAFVASITPGPTNILVLSNSARHGWRASVPILLGACAGAAGLVLIVGSGLGQVLLDWPLAQRAMAWAGVLWLSWLAWGLYRSAAFEEVATDTHTRLSAGGAAALQLINPKSWMMALTVLEVFSAGAEHPAAHVALLAGLFFMVSVPCMACWAWLGAYSTRVMRSPSAVRRFNRAMAVLLLIAAWWALGSWP